MIEGLVLLLVFQLLGNVAEMYFHLPVPGSVLGMFLLLVALIANDRLASWVRPISLVLISYLAVLFVPAGVGIMLHIDRLKNEALPIGVSLVVSTILTIAVTALVIKYSTICRNAKNGRRQGMNNIDFHGIEEIWSSLSTSSLLWLTVTLAAYLFAQKLYKWSNWNSLLNPVAVSIVTVVLLLMATHTPYQTYFSGAQFIHFLLGPTTVALAVPLYDLRIQLAKNWLPILLGLFAGAFTAITSTVLIAGLLGASPETIISLAPKSVTTPIAMSIAEKLGGLPALSASLVVLTGVLGSICAGPLFLLLKVDSSSAKGFALGLSAHGMGTSRAFQIDSTAGAYGSLAIGLTGLTTALLAPLLTPLLMKIFF